jgi:hypothetical protein
MIRHRFMVKGINLRTLLTWLALGCFLTGLATVTPALAQAPAGPQVLMEKPPEGAKPEEKKEEAPTTCGPICCDTCVPIETGHFALSTVTALSFFPGFFSNNWRTVSAHGNFNTFYMPWKLTYGPTKNLEMYIIAPFITNWASKVDFPGPNGETSASYSGIGDLTMMAKYNLLPEGEIMPAVTGVAGLASIPTGHANHLNATKLAMDAVGTGALTFTSGVNLYKWLKPFLVYSNIWMNNPVNLYKLGPEPGRTVRSRDYVTFNLAAEYPLSKQFVLLLEMYSNWTWSNLNQPLTNAPLAQGYQTPQTVIGVLPAIEFLATEKLSMSAGASFDVAGKNGVKKYTPMLYMSYAF